ncbi:alpha/beta fold hydrolase [Streptomyces sp. W16]|uniref:thioesterase II family protein n=1 Tax=Streptomyces sp. W16 TaxID=3076631 RepID=UPI00295B656A|nr:alpha/beta fold hydrolase [Streptomyces sp. W16]MDV9178012.1 alpha/beta fold hydrolase [Streptomyces sp. W16]
MSSAPSADRIWLRRLSNRTVPAAEPRARIVCFPHAGGSARFFLPWVPLLPPSVELWAVQYPGRDDRIAHPLARSLEQLVLPVADLLTEWHRSPLVLFGHSLGATVAYEVARVLRSRRPAAIQRLFVSGRTAPSAHRPGTVHHYDDDRLAAELARPGGTDPELLADPGIRELVLPVVRADFRLAETYRHRPGPQLTCPVTAFVGDGDPAATPATTADWRDCTSGPFDLHVLPGDHFYLIPQRAHLISRLLRHLEAPHPNLPTTVRGR